MLASQPQHQMWSSRSTPNHPVQIQKPIEGPHNSKSSLIAAHIPTRMSSIDCRAHKVPSERIWRAKWVALTNKKVNSLLTHKLKMLISEWWRIIANVNHLVGIQRVIIKIKTLVETFWIMSWMMHTISKNRWISQVSSKSTKWCNLSNWNQKHRWKPVPYQAIT